MRARRMPALGENAPGNFGKRKSFCLRLLHWETSGLIGEKSELAHKSRATVEIGSLRPLQSGARAGVFTQPRWKSDVRGAVQQWLQCAHGGRSRPPRNRPNADVRPGVAVATRMSAAVVADICPRHHGVHWQRVEVASDSGALEWAPFPRCWINRSAHHSCNANSTSACSAASHASLPPRYQ